MWEKFITLTGKLSLWVSTVLRREKLINLSSLEDMVKETVALLPNFVAKSCWISAGDGYLIGCLSCVNYICGGWMRQPFHLSVADVGDDSGIREDLTNVRNNHGIVCWESSGTLVGITAGCCNVSVSCQLCQTNTTMGLSLIVMTTLLPRHQVRGNGRQGGWAGYQELPSGGKRLPTEKKSSSVSKLDDPHL